ncbi:MAG: hypothetical protein ACNYPE_15455 [Candidatus Azotimanducaceae bacterium WSBS_2022_MAG_OTU7]
MLELGEKPFHVGQTAKWIHRRFVSILPR